MSGIFIKINDRTFKNYIKEAIQTQAMAAGAVMYFA